MSVPAAGASEGATRKASASIAGLLLFLSGGLSIWIGLAVGNSIPGGAVDFQGVYYATRCLMEHHDPYKLSELRATYMEAARELPPGGIYGAEDVLGFVYQPTVFPLIAPFVWLGWGVAYPVWTFLLIVGLFGAALLMWQVAAPAVPRTMLALACLVLANCAVSIGSGNPAGLAVSLCVVAVWCILEGQFATVGVLCLALSLLLKPHDTVLVWLFLLMAGGRWRHRAWQTLVVTAVVGTAALAWVTAVAPAWRTEWKENLVAIGASGKMNNPGALTAAELHLTRTIVDLQAVVAVFWRDAKVYNAVSYAVCGALLLLGAAVTLRRRLTVEQVWLGLAAVVPLALLLIYHRPYDARLLLLTIPGCALLVRRGGWTGKASLALTAAAIFLTGDLTTSVLVGMPEYLNANATTLAGKVTILLLTRAGVLALLAMSIFHAAVYVRMRDDDQLGAILDPRPESKQLATALH